MEYYRLPLYILFGVLPSLIWLFYYLKKDLHWYLNRLEQTAIDLLSGFDILAHRISGKTGVWVNERKIVSMGVGIKKWVTFHGLAINVNTDLKLFSLIRPCGLDVAMTSISNIKNSVIDMNLVKQNFLQHFKNNFRAHHATLT